MRDPLLDLPSTPPSSSSAEHSSREPSSSSSRDPHRVQRSLEMFNSLQQAMYNTYASLPPDAQHALLQRAGTPSAASASGFDHSHANAQAETTYLSLREQRARAMDAINNSSLYRQRGQQPQQQQQWDPRGRDGAPQPPSAASWSRPGSSSSHHSHSPSPPPPAPLHRVYVLRCATCDQFLSDRGMRAVLLLKPNIVLFSTDATPSSAGPIWPEPRGANGDNAERTCDCLTSSLGCHGCGTVVGYHIVQPCARCTASVQKHQRSANHHRYVFHHNEVVSSEREYFPGERGITGARYVPSASRPSSSPSPSASPVPPPASESEHKDAAYRSSRERRQAERDAAARARAEEEKATRLRRGDTLYWHNLVQGGERTEPVDPKTRPRRVVERVGR